MYRHLLLPTDGSELSDRAVEAGIGLARALGARVTGFYARPSATMELDRRHASRNAQATLHDLESCQAGLDEAAALVLGRVASLAAEHGVECDVVCAESNHPAEAIIEVARQRDCDLVLMGSHGRSGIEALALGSVTRTLLSHSKLPVLVVR